MAEITLKRMAAVVKEISKLKDWRNSHFLSTNARVRAQRKVVLLTNFTIV